MQWDPRDGSWSNTPEDDAAEAQAEIDDATYVQCGKIMEHAEVIDKIIIWSKRLYDSGKRDGDVFQAALKKAGLRLNDNIMQEAITKVGAYSSSYFERVLKDEFDFTAEMPWDLTPNCKERMRDVQNKLAKE